jgi:hypothetical protein
LGTAKTITFLTNSLIIIWRDISPTLRGTSCLWSLQKSGAHKILAGSSPILTQYVPTYFGKILGLKKHLKKIE